MSGDKVVLLGETSFDMCHHSFKVRKIMESQYSGIYKMMTTQIVILLISSTSLFFDIGGFAYYVAYFFIILSVLNLIKLIRYLLQHKKTGSYFKY